MTDDEDATPSNDASSSSYPSLHALLLKLGLVVYEHALVDNGYDKLEDVKDMVRMNII
jgi:hypothetical protein